MKGLLLAAVCLVAAPTSVARADAPPPAAKTEARDRFALGLRLFEKGETAAALAEFKRAYELVPNPLVLYNIGLVYAAMERPVESADALEGFLRDGAAAAAGEPGRRAREVLAEQSKRIAELRVVTNRPARIDIDGIEAGMTPMAHPLRLSSGAHVVSAEAPGYLPLRQAVTLAGQVAETVTLELLPAESVVAHLSFAVSVPGAEVLVDGKSVGTTPLPASIAVPPGAATIEVRRAGYRTATRALRLDEGSSGSVELALEEDPGAPAALKGRLRLAVSEPESEIMIDGVRKGSGSATLALVAGPHRLRVERTGFMPFEGPIDVVAGAETPLIVTLAPTPETRELLDQSARVRHAWGGATVGVGVALAAGAAIYAAVTHDDIATAQGQLQTQLAAEMDVNNHCYAGPGNEGRYAGLHCATTKSYYQDQVSSAKLHRDLAYAGVGVGVVAAGVGTYLLLSGRAAQSEASQVSRVALWTDGQGAGFVATGRF